MLAFRKNPIAMLWASLPVRAMMESVCPSALMQMQVLAIVRVIITSSLIHFLRLSKIEMVNLGQVQQFVLFHTLSKQGVQLVHQLRTIVLACLNEQKVRTGFLPLCPSVVNNRLFRGVADSIDVRHCIVLLCFTVIIVAHIGQFVKRFFQK